MPTTALAGKAEIHRYHPCGVGYDPSALTGMWVAEFGPGFPSRPIGWP
jgi:hypothetical protein